MTHIIIILKKLKKQNTMKKQFYKMKFGILMGVLLGFVALLQPAELKAQITGNYTLDPTQAASASNYLTFTSFVRDLRNLGRLDGGTDNNNGLNVTGPVTLNVASGQTFTEQIEITQITGVTATNRVTINGNGSTLQFNATVTTARHTLWLNGADFFTFNNLKIVGLNATNVYTVRLSNQANYNLFENCEISAPNYNYTAATITLTGTNTTSVFTNSASAGAVVAFVTANNNLQNTTDGTNGRGNRFINNKILGPADNSNITGPTYGFFEQNAQSTATGENEFIGNEIRNFSGIGIYSWRASGGKYNNNILRRNLNVPGQSNVTNAYMYGIWLHYPHLNYHAKNIEIIGNDIKGFGRTNVGTGRYFYGIAVSRTNGLTSSVNTILKIRVEQNIVADNYIGNTSTTSAYFYGIYTYYAARTDVINNIVANNRPITYSNLWLYTYQIYHFYSRGGDLLHNTVYDAYTLPSNQYYYNYGLYQYNCCTNSPPVQDIMKFNNNIAYFDIMPRSFHYDYNVSYIYYPTEVKSNLFFSEGGLFNYRHGYGNVNGTLWQYYPSIDALNSSAPDNICEKNIGVNPNFVNAANLNFAFTNPALNAAGVNSGITTDFNGNPRNPNFPDIGAIEVPFDYAISGTFQLGSEVCGGDQENIKATVHNLMPFPLPNPRIGYILNNKPPRFKAGGTLPASGNLEITFDEPVQFFGEPTNSVLKVFIAHADDNNVNDTLYFNITVKRAPYGSSLIPNLTTQAKISDFPMVNPDVSIPDELVEFQVTPPALYTNNNYTTSATPGPGQWTASTNAFVVGSMAPAGGLTWTPPVGGNNGVWSYDPQFVNENQTIEIQLKIVDNICDTIIRRRVLVAPIGSAQFKLPAQICLGEEIEFENESDVSSGFLYYEWNFGNGQTSDATNGKTVYSTPGSYDVKLYNITEPHGFITSNTITINVTEAPIPNFSFINKCFGTPVQFSNSSTVGSGTVGGTTWDFGNGSNAIGETTSHLYAVEGMYPVTMTTQANGCVKSITKNILQFAQPTADFTLQSGSCQYGEFKFNNNSNVEFGFIGYTWKFGENGSLSTANNPTYKYKTAGSKKVTLIATTALGCTDSVTQTVNVQPGPSADFILSNECQHKNITFTSTDMIPGGINALYNWNLAEAGTAMTSNANASYTWPGERNISLQVQYNNGCKNTISKKVIILPTPIANFELVNSCAGDEVQFANLTSSATGTLAYNWSFGDGNNSSSAKPTHTYSTNTNATYDIVLTATVVGGCSDMISKSIEIYAKPVTCDFVFEHSGANGFRNFKFEPTDGTNIGAQSGVTYNWFIGDGSSITNKSIAEHNFMKDDTYEVTMVASNDNDCECRMTKSVSIDMVGVVEINSNQSFMVYPNPNTGSFNINLNGFNGKTKIEVLTISGQSIFANEINGLFTTVDLGKVSTGMYLVKITNNGQSTMTKVQVTNN
jgi:PKD repeat protein